MVVRVSDKKQTYNNVTKLLVKPSIIHFHTQIIWLSTSAFPLSIVRSTDLIILMN